VAFADLKRGVDVSKGMSKKVIRICTLRRDSKTRGSRRPCRIQSAIVAAWIVVTAKSVTAQGLAIPGRCNDTLRNNTVVETSVVPSWYSAICSSPSTRINLENHAYVPRAACRAFATREPVIVLESESFSEESLTPPKPCTLQSVFLSKICAYDREGKVTIGWTFPEDLDLKNLVPVKTRAALKELKKRVPECFDSNQDHSSD
jgi:hypothetical protein